VNNIIIELLKILPSLDILDQIPITTKNNNDQNIIYNNAYTNNNKKLIQLIQMLHLKYLSFSNKERVWKGNSDNTINWENELILLLQQQVESLKSLDNKEDNHVVVFVDYRKNVVEYNNSIADYNSNNNIINPLSNKTVVNNKNGINNYNNIIGIISFQKVYRGYIVRKKIKFLLKSIRYEDNELDELMQFDMNENEFLFNDIEDDINYNNISWSSNQSNNDSVSTTMVYGDHIRKRSAKLAFPLQNDNYLDEVVVTQKKNNNDNNNYTNNNISNNNIDYSSRPSTNMSSVSNRSLLSAKTEQEGNIINDEEDDNNNNKISIADEDWGISDPKLLAAMKKRTTRIKLDKYDIFILLI
jgi:hypothetical protein